MSLSPQDLARFAARCFELGEDVCTTDELQQAALEAVRSGDRIHLAALYRRALDMGGDPGAWETFLTSRSFLAPPLRLSSLIAPI